VPPASGTSSVTESYFFIEPLTSRASTFTGATSFTSLTVSTGTANGPTRIWFF
jgi:hypothetical protein